MQTIDHEQKPKFPWGLIALVIAFAAALFWTVNHIIGGCLGLEDVVTYCHYGKVSVVIGK